MERRVAEPLAEDDLGPVLLLESLEGQDVAGGARQEEAVQPRFRSTSARSAPG